jgi:hypothetical protein
MQGVVGLGDTVKVNIFSFFFFFFFFFFFLVEFSTRFGLKRLFVSRLSDALSLELALFVFMAK